MNESLRGRAAGRLVSTDYTPPAHGGDREASAPPPLCCACSGRRDRRTRGVTGAGHRRGIGDPVRSPGRTSPVSHATTTACAPAVSCSLVMIRLLCCLDRCQSGHEPGRDLLVGQSASAGHEHLALALGELGEARLDGVGGRSPGSYPVAARPSRLGTTTQAVSRDQVRGPNVDPLGRLITSP